MLSVDLLQTTINDTAVSSNSPEVDGNLLTCSVTPLEHDPQWQTVLQQHYLIHTVIVLTGVEFGCKDIIW